MTNFVANPLGEGLPSLLPLPPRPLVIARLLALMELSKFPNSLSESISFGADGVGQGVLNHYKHDSKAHLPFVCQRNLAYMHIQLLEVEARAKHDNAYASGFKVSLLDQ